MTPYFKQNEITIYHGDCEYILPSLPVADLLLTDPPYGIGESALKNNRREKMAKPKNYGSDNWDTCPIEDRVFLMAIRSAKNKIVWGGNYYCHLLKPGPGWLVWDKKNTGDFSDCEIAWTSFDTAARLRRHMWNGMIRKNREPRFHLTQKPLEIMKWCIAYADKSCSVKTIIDPFMGSGTTLRAAMEMGRSAVGIEKEEKYCEIAAKRLAQQVLF
jgi:DNA modification methylase